MKVTDKECECSEDDSLRCQEGETCVKPRDTGASGASGGASAASGAIGASGGAECQVPCSNPAWDDANNIESGDPDQEYLLGEHSFTCAQNHYVMTQKVIFEDQYKRQHWHEKQAILNQSKSLSTLNW